MKKKTVSEVLILREIVRDLQWMARRYANRGTAADRALINKHTLALIAMAVPLNVKMDGTLWAKTADEREYASVEPHAPSTENPERVFIRMDSKGEVSEEDIREAIGVIARGLRDGSGDN
jgi:hypothetical protein